MPPKRTRSSSSKKLKKTEKSISNPNSRSVSVVNDSSSSSFIDTITKTFGNFFDSNTQLFIVHINVFIYALCYWLSSPILPYLIKQFSQQDGDGNKSNSSSLSFGTFQSVFNACQLFGGLVVGWMTDRFDGSSALSLTQFGSSLVYLVLLFSSSMTWLYASRVITVVQQAMQVAQAITSKSVSTKDRAVHFGRLSLSYAAGMISGTFLSGRLSTWYGNSLPLALAAILSISVVPVNFLFLKKGKVSLQKKDDDNANEKEEGKKENYFSLLFKLKGICFFLACIYVTRSLFEPVANVLLLNRYKIEKQTNAELLSLFAGIGLITNVFMIPLLLKYGSEKNVMRFSILVGAIAFALLSFFTDSSSSSSDDVRIFIILMSVVTFASSILYTLTTSFISHNTPSSSHGQAIALSHAIRSAIGVVAPVVGTGLYDYTGGSATIAALNAVLLTIAALLV